MKSRFYQLVGVLALICLSQLFAYSQTPVHISKVPTKTADIQKVAAQKNIVRVPRLQPAVKLNLAKRLLTGKVAPKTLDSLTLGAPISLDVRNGYLENQAYLQFYSVGRVAANLNAAYLSSNKIFDISQPLVALYFYAPAPGFYIFDLSIGTDYQGAATPTLTFVVDGDFANKQTQNFEEKDQHLLFATQIKTAGDSWHLILLGSQNVDWTFYSVEISQLK